MSFSDAADWPQDPGLDGPNTLCNAGLRPSPTPELLVLRASAWQSVVYAEQPPAASSTNAGGACSAGPSGVGLGRRAGTVASARTKLGRPEERQAERAGAADASTLPPSSRRKVKLCSSTLRYWNRVSLFHDGGSFPRPPATTRVASHGRGRHRVKPLHARDLSSVG